MTTDDRAHVASDLLDRGIRFIRQISVFPEGNERVLVRRAGQLLRLMSQQVRNGTSTVEEGLAWRDAADMTLRRLDARHN